MKRSQARETALALLFEKEFNKEAEPEDILRLAEDDRELEKDEYVEKLFFGVSEKLTEVDAAIEKRLIGWKLSRITRISRSILRISAYEMLFCEDVPFSVSINEAVELAKKYDDDKAPGFVNGVLNGVAEDLGLKV